MIVRIALLGLALKIHNYFLYFININYDFITTTMVVIKKRPWKDLNLRPFG